MKNRIRNGIVAFMAFAMPVAALSQGSSINTYSPYTLYGIGDMYTQGTSLQRSMGGIGMGFRSPIAINYLNPASYSAIRQNSFLLNFGMAGGGFYLKNNDTKTSNNTFNLSNISVSFPMAKGMGFGVTVAPYSSVGYYVQDTETDPDILAKIGQVDYIYSGEGGINQIKAGLGINLTKRLSVGAEMIYLLGNISRVSVESITPVTSNASPNSTAVSMTESYSKVFGALGVQYDVLSGPKRVMTIGARYQIGGKLDPECTRFIPSNNLYSDTVYMSSYSSDFRLPSSIAAGIFYQTPKFGVGADYTFQKWEGSNDDYGIVSYRNTNLISAGMQYTPNFGDIRHFMRRITYRVGVRYSDYYLMLRGEQLSDKSLTFGVGIPLKMTGLTNINLGLEVGSRGTTKSNLIREDYFKFTIGLSLFGEDYWFMKHKFD